MRDVKYKKKGTDLHEQLAFEKTLEQVILRDRLVVVQEARKVVGQWLDAIISQTPFDSVFSRLVYKVA